MVLQESQGESHDLVENSLQEELPTNQVHATARVSAEWSAPFDAGGYGNCSIAHLVSNIYRLFPKATLSKSAAILITYTGEQIPLAGQMEVEVSFNKQHQRLTVYVTMGDRPSLFGREWLRALKLDWECIKMACLAESQC